MKKELSEAIFAELQPFQERRRHYEQNPHEVDRIIQEGNEKAKALAEATVREVRDKMGLL